MTQSGGGARARSRGTARSARRARRGTRAGAESRRPTCDSSPASSARWISLGLGRRPVARARRPPARPGAAARRGPATRGCAGSAGTRPSAPPERAARQRALLLAHVAPQVQQREEVRALVGEARVRRVGLGLLVGRAARAGPGSTARRRSRSPRRRSRAASASSTIRPIRGSTGSCASAPAERRQLRLARRARRAPAAASIAVAHLAAVGRVEEREVLDRRRARRRHLQDHRGEVRAQDLGVGEARARRRSPPRRRGGCRCRPTCARSGPCAGRPRPARSARSAAAAPSAARCSG